MSKTLSMMAALAILGACAMTTGGTGSMTDGSSVIGTLSGNPAVNLSTVQIISPKGWACTGSYDHNDFDGTSTTVPLTCDNGAKGSGVMVFERFALNFVMAFRLDSGDEGSVKFAFRNN